MLDQGDQIGQKLLPEFVSLQNKPGMFLLILCTFGWDFRLKERFVKIKEEKVKKNVSFAFF